MRAFAILAASLLLAVVIAAVGVTVLLDRGHAQRAAKRRTDRRHQMEQAAHEMSAAEASFSRDLRIVVDHVARSTDETERQRLMQALVDSVGAYRAMAVYAADGTLQTQVVDPSASPEARRGDYQGVLSDAARQAWTEPPGQITISTRVTGGGPDRWLRAFAVALPERSLSVAALVDTEPMSASFKVIAADPEVYLLLIGPHGHTAPPSNAFLEGWYDTAPGTSVPALRAALTQARAGQASEINLTASEAEELGLERDEMQATCTPVSVQDGSPWALVTIVSTGAQRIRERALTVQIIVVTTSVLMGLMAFAAFVVASSRRAVALRESERHAERLAQLQKRTQEILDHVPTGVLALDAQGRITSVNHALQRRLPRVAPGLDLSTAFRDAPEVVVAWLRELHEAALRTHSVQSLLGVDLPLFGTEGQYSLHLVPLEGGDPEVQMLLVVEDLTALQALEGQLLRAEKLATVGVLAAGIAHEIGTPLGVVRGRAEYIQNKLGEGHPQRAGMNVIIEQIDRVSRTIRQLLDFSHLRPGTLQPVELSHALRSMRELLRLEAERRRISLDLDEASDLPPLLADPDQLQQVLINLTFNAFDACEAGGRVRIWAERVEQGKVRLSVADNGCGIPKERLNQVFDPFFTTKKRGQGTGLGLSMVAQIVRNHGATIAVQSELGRGTIMTMVWPTTLPRAIPPLQAVG